MTNIEKQAEEVAIPMPKGKRAVLVVAILVAIIAQMFMTYSLTTAAPTICTELNGFEWYALMFSAATLFQCVFTPASTAIGRIFTQRRTLILGTFLMLLQFLGTWFAPSVQFIVISRIVGHIGCAFVSVVGVGMFADLFPPQETPKYTGYYSMVMSLCGVVGPIVAGALCDVATWRYLPLISLIISIVAIALLIYACPKIPRRTDAEKTDVSGIITMAIAIIALTVIVSFAGTYFAWVSWQTGLLVVLFIVFIVVFINIEKKKSDGALMPVKLWKNKIFLAGFLLGFFGDGAAYVIRIYLPAYGQLAMETSATYSGLLVSIPSILSIFVAIFFGHFLAKTGKMKLVAFLGIICQILCCLFVITGGPDTNQIFYLLIITILFGLSNGLVAFVPLAMVQARLPHKYVGISTAVVMLGVTLGCTIVVAVAGMFQNMGFDSYTTYRVIMIFDAIVTAIVIPFICILPSDKKANAELAAQAAEDSVDKAV